MSPGTWEIFPLCLHFDFNSFLHGVVSRYCCLNGGAFTDIVVLLLLTLVTLRSAACNLESHTLTTRLRGTPCMFGWLVVGTDLFSNDIFGKPYISDRLQRLDCRDLFTGLRYEKSQNAYINTSIPKSN